MDQKQKDQQKFVLSELSSCSQWKYKHNEDASAPPREVIAARAVIKRYEKAKELVAKRLYREYSRKYATIRREVYFGSLTKALKLVDALRKECGK